jgi:hypothetical protein
MQHREYAKRAAQLGDHLQAALSLSDAHLYPSVLVVVRAALEPHLMDRLIFLATRYVQSYGGVKVEDLPQEEARLTALRDGDRPDIERWWRDPETGQMHVVIRGLHSNRSKKGRGQIISPYYFRIDDFDPLAEDPPVGRGVLPRPARPLEAAPPDMARDVHGRRPPLAVRAAVIYSAVSRFSVAAILLRASSRGRIASDIVRHRRVGPLLPPRPAVPPGLVARGHPRGAVTSPPTENAHPCPCRFVVRAPAQAQPPTSNCSGNYIIVSHPDARLSSVTAKVFQPRWRATQLGGRGTVRQADCAVALLRRSVVTSCWRPVAPSSRVPTPPQA